MEIVVSNEVSIVDPTPQVREWCNRELVIPNPDYEKKKRMGFWLGNTPQYMYLYKEVRGNLVIPLGAYKQMYDAMPEEIFDYHKEYFISDNGIVDYNGAVVPLYDYQKEAVVHMKWECGGILQAPAGSGKTQMGIALVLEHKAKALWLTHTKDLLQQSYDRAAQYIDESMLGTITGGKVNIGSGITFATVQTMANLDLSQYKYEWDVIIVDECHRVAGSPTKYTQFSKVLSSLAAWSKYGLSATVHRADGLIKATFALLGKVAYEVPEEATKGKIEQVRIVKCNTGIPIHSSCLDTDGTLLYGKLIDYLCHNRYRNAQIASELIENDAHYNLVLSDRIEHLSELYELLPDNLQEVARVITGKTKAEERKQVMQDMRDGKIHYLFATYRLAKEGLDIPRLDRLYLATPQKDYAIIVQSIGRIARHFDGKGEPVCYDYVDDIRFCEGQWKKRCASYRKIHCKM